MSAKGFRTHVIGIEHRIPIISRAFVHLAKPVFYPER